MNLRQVFTLPLPDAARMADAMPPEFKGRAWAIIELRIDQATRIRLDDNFWNRADNKTIAEDKHIDPVFIPSDRV